VDAAALATAPCTLRGAEDDSREAASAAAELIARLVTPGSSGGGSSDGRCAAVEWLAAAAARLGGGEVEGAAAEAEEAVVNFCLMGLMAPAMLGFKASDGERVGSLSMRVAVAVAVCRLGVEH